jgi:hypothetical protein
MLFLVVGGEELEIMAEYITAVDPAAFCFHHPIISWGFSHSKESPMMVHIPSHVLTMTHIDYTGGDHLVRFPHCTVFAA